MTKLNPRRATLCSTLAIATALLVGASPAAAQALLGTVTSSTGVGTITTGAGQTTIPVTGQQAVINWSATGPSSGGVTTFSNAGSTTNFTGQRNFAILNRVAPTVSGNSIFMGGNINSSINEAVGGTVYFYSPNGIIIGGNATINVGSLGLTTLPISDVGGVWMSGFGSVSPQVAFGAATNAASFIRTQASASGAMLANGPGNYIALVAPRIEHRGIIRTDSGAALVAAGAATITFNPSGLYNIVVTTGSSDANGVVVDVGRIERNSAVVGASHRAYLVSVPANNAMTMVVQGGAQLGFEIAGSAAVENNSVVLSAGRNVSGGSAVGAQAGPASVSIDNATIRSSLFMDATANARISSTNGTTLLAGNVAITAPGEIIVAAQNHRLSIGGSLDAVADKFGGNGVGGAIIVAAQNGQTLAVGGNTYLSVKGRGVSAADNGRNAGDGTGGQINLQSTEGGAINIAGALSAFAGGNGGGHGFSNGNAGSGTGGTVNINANGGNSAISVGGITTLDVNGTGGFAVECNACSVGGGSGTGGTINVNGGVRAANSGPNRLDFNGGLSLAAQGVGQAGDAAAGSGRGGILRLVTSDGTIVNSQLGFIMTAGGFGGAYLGNGVGNGGDGTGGDLQIGAYDSAGGTFNLVGGQGQMILSADGLGGDAVSGTGTGGIGQGGRIAIDAKGAAIALGGDVFMDVVGDGGSAIGGTGGRAAGGSVFAHAFGSDLTISGNLILLATAFGGHGLIGGLSQGGTVSAAADTGSRLSISGQANLDASSLGGQGGVLSGNRGGRAQGGDATLVAGTGGSLAVGSVFLSAFAFGGGGYEGGAAQGGHGAIASNLGNIDISGAVFGFVSAIGGSSHVVNGSAATGGRFDLFAAGGTLDVAGPVTLATSAFGGATFGDVATGGTGTGGGLQVQARNGGILTLGGDLFASSEAHGGDAFESTARAGDGLGGSVNFGAIGTNATVDARGLVSLSADGMGGFAVCGECTTGGAGGNGTGGQAFVQASGGTGNRILTRSSVLISANGLGGGGHGGAGGNGQGGAASVFLTNNAQIAVGGGLAINARGDGGYHANGGQAGAGTGGEALINLAGGPTSLLSVGTNNQLELDLTTLLDSSGYGGSAGVVAGGIGGAGTGGWSRIYGTGGSATFAGNVVIEAEGLGGAGENGAGGAGIGGRARLNADGAAYHLFADATIVTDARGGAGRNGGAASLRNIDNENNSGVFANNNGSIVIDGATLVSANAFGGGGRNGGNGGSAIAGLANVVANGSALGNGSITLSRAAISADSSGGNGAAGGAGLAGGNGGSATGGIAELGTTNSLSGTNRVTVGNATITALAQGGFGGLGGGGSNGARGGNGGIGTGGTALALSGAGNGAFTVTNLAVNAYAFGGHGGDGGSGSTGVGGSGGTAASGDGGVVVAGIASGLATPTTNSVFTVANLTGFADSYGGVGGDGGVGATGSGNGGNGGDALVSFNQLLARGGTVSIGNARLTVDARGGNGGLGAVAGNGGTAYSPNVEVIVTNRFNQPTAGATLTVGVLDLHGNAYGGTGATTGRALALGGPQLLVQNSNAQFGSFSAVTRAGNGIVPESLPDAIRIINGRVTADKGFVFATDNRMSVLLANGSLTAGTVALGAATFERDATFAPTTPLGTITAGTIAVTSRRDILLDAHLSSVGPLTLGAPGSVTVGNLTSTGAAAGSDIIVTGGTNVTTGAISASRAVDIRAGGTLTTGVASARTDVSFNAGGAISTGTIGSQTGGIRAVSGSNITTGNLAAGGALLLDARGGIATGDIAARSAELFAVGTVQVGNVTTSEGFDAEAEGALSVGNVTAGESITLAARAALAAGNLSAGLVNATVREGARYNIGIVSGTSVAVGNASARDWIGIGTRGALGAGTISSGNDVLLAADGPIQTGAIATGPQSRLLIAGANMVALGGPIDAFDRSRVFAALGTSAQAATRGTVTIGGPVSTGRMNALVGGNFASGNITAALLGIDASAGGTLTTGVLSAKTDIGLGAVGAITTLAISSQSGGIRAIGGGNITTGNLAAGGGVTFDARGSIVTGTIAARWVDLFAIGSIQVGDATIDEWLDAEAEGALTAGNVTAGEEINLAANGAVIAGNLSAGIVNAAVRSGAEYSIGILSGTSVAVGNASARDWIGIGTRGTLTAGTINSRNDVLLLADGAIRTGAITTGAESRLLIAGADMVALGGRNEDFDRNRVFVALGTNAQAATRGAVTVDGVITTRTMDALVGTDFTTGALTATNAAIATVGGTMVINGAWSSALTRITSNDLVIGANGGIGGGRTDLFSRNATQLLVGDGLSGSGYVIDNAEFGRLSAGIINVVGRSDASAAIDTLVGTLSLIGRSGGSSVTIATASGSASEPAGSLRVTGAVTGTGFGANDALTLAAGRVEIDAATGGVSLGGSNGQLGGAFTLVGQRVHVAEGAILDRLAADPNYAARDAELARAPATQRPEGVIRAGEIVVKLVDPPGQVSEAVRTAALSPYSVLVQNVGTSRIPAGFTATMAKIVSSTGTAPGSIDLNVNGQLVTSTATLTGVAVRDALMADDDPARFTATSLINGCALVGPCGLQSPPFDPQPALSAEIALLSTPPADDALFGNEEAIEDNEDEGGDDSASSPIAPPAPLFNTKPLEQKSDTDEPVSGGGNPALIGSGPVEGEK